MLERAYRWMMNLASHPQAMTIVFCVSFAESSFSPFPPDPIYFAMILAHRERAFLIATLVTVASILGGFLGYGIGYWLYQGIGKTIIDFYGLTSSFENMRTGFNDWAFWLIALKGLTPIPYKIVTIASGVAHVDLWTFTSASVIARGSRFYLIALLLWYYGEPVKQFIEKNLLLVTLITVSVIVGGFFLVTLVG